MNSRVIDHSRLCATTKISVIRQQNLGHSNRDTRIAKFLVHHRDLNIFFMIVYVYNVGN